MNNPPDPTGTGWTQWKSIADAIDRSHACNGGMVVLVTNDGEDFIAMSAELAGICEDQTQINENVYEYKHAGMFDDDPSPGWAIQLTLV